MAADCMAIFFRGMQDFDRIGCPLPCSYSNYLADVVYQHKNAYELYTGNKYPNYFLLYYYYLSLDTVVSSESLIVDLANLIANVGGNLGLFLGFSCLSVYIAFLDFLQRKMQ